MSCGAEYALVDVGNGRSSEGKILLLVGDELTAQEIAAELRRRGCRVAIKAIDGRSRPLEARPGGPGLGRRVNGNAQMAVPTTR